MESKKEEFVTTLILPDEYSHHLNEVSGLTTESIIFLKRKFFSRAGHELIKYRLNDCKSIVVHDERPLHRIVFGCLLVSLIAFIFYCIYLYWASLEPGTRIYIGLFGLALFAGFRWILGARRHRIIFLMKNGKKLIWKSSAGDFQVKEKNVGLVSQLAMNRNIYKSGKSI